MSKVITIDQKQEVLNTFNANPSGCFIGIQGYENSHGEIANYTIQSGVNYGNIKNLSIEKLNDIKAGKDIKDITVKCDIWENADGTVTNRKATGRTFKTITTAYKWDSDDFQKACDEILQGMLAPKKVEQSYDKEAKGLYSIDDDTLYIRECLVVTKAVVKDGVYPESAQLPFNALKDAIRKLLPVANYRTFKLESFQSITINGSIII